MSEPLQDRVDAALSEAFRDEQDSDMRAGIVTEWAVTCEIAGMDGDVWLHTLRSKDSTAWKVLGMLEAHAGDLRVALAGKDDE